MDGLQSAMLSVSGLHCGSCEAVIRRTLSKLQGVESIRVTGESVAVDFQPGQVTLEHIARAIAEKGYRASGPGIDFRPVGKGVMGSFRFFLSDPAMLPERDALQIGVYALVLLFVAQHFVFQGIFPAATATARSLATYLIISVVAVGSALWHFTSFKRMVSCGTGMMIGMTIGMVSGFLTGAVVGASNGIFIGSVYGVFAGMLVGSLAGRPAGIMGIMEGMMAGLMAGVMGGMIPLMFLTDNLFLFLPILTGACVLILTGLTYYISWENREYEKAHGQPPGRSPMKLISFIGISFIITFLTTWLMVLGPKSALVGQLGG